MIEIDLDEVVREELAAYKEKLQGKSTRRVLVGVRLNQRLHHVLKQMCIERGESVQRFAFRALLREIDIARQEKQKARGGSEGSTAA